MRMTNAATKKYGVMIPLTTIAATDRSVVRRKCSKVVDNFCNVQQYNNAPHELTLKVLHTYGFS